LSGTFGIGRCSLLKDGREESKGGIKKRKDFTMEEDVILEGKKEGKEGRKRRKEKKNGRTKGRKDKRTEGLGWQDSPRNARQLESTRRRNR
jgi:hypothetical protein